MEKPKTEELEYWGQWKAPAIAISFWGDWGLAKAYNELGLSAPPFNGDMFILDGHHFYYKKDFEQVLEATKKGLKENNGAFFEKFFELSEKACDNLQDFSKWIEKQKNFANPGREFEKFCGLFLEITSLWTIIFPLSNIVEAELQKKAITLGFSSEKIPLLSHPERESFIMQQQNKARKFALELRDLGFLKAGGSTRPSAAMQKLQRQNPALANNILSHLARFEWIGTHHFWGEKMTLEKLFIQMQELLQKNPSIEEQKIPEQLSFLVSISKKLAFYRLYYTEATDWSAFRCRRLFAEFSRAHGFPEDHFIWMTFRELNAIGRKKARSVPEIEIKKRQEKFGSALQNHAERVILGKELDGLLSFLLEKLSPIEKEIRGTVASRGKATGKVRIVTTPAESRELLRGEILVCPETTPDFVPAMRRAVAIVTDIGGMTSHAAIISREFGIPCIVGTKTATRSLKNGDIVKVDAENGIVKKIEK